MIPTFEQTTREKAELFGLMAANAAVHGREVEAWVWAFAACHYGTQALEPFGCTLHGYTPRWQWEAAEGCPICESFVIGVDRARGRDFSACVQVPIK